MVPVTWLSDLQMSGRNMSLIRPSARSGPDLLQSVLGLVNAAYAQSGTDHRVPAHPPGSQLALDQRPTVAGRRWQPTAEEIDRRINERGTTPSGSAFRDEDSEVQRLYDEMMRQTDPALRPWELRPE
jgi:hypothetical protein